MIGGRIVIDLSAVSSDGWEEAHSDRHKLQVLDQCPDGVEVVVQIGQRRYISQDAAYWLHQHDARLQILIEGADPKAVQHFVAAARAGEWSVVA